jgi:aromatic ring-opening dioxygenase catalytic subunit (LigB family)
MTLANPPMLYDYSGFLPETYKIVYPAPGVPRVEAWAVGLILAAGLPVRSDGKRGFDHSCFVLVHVLYPGALVPVVQISLRVSTWRWAVRSCRCGTRGC